MRSITFNYLNTYQWFRERVYKLEEEGHDYADREKAIEKSLEYGDRIPIGIFYEERRPIYRENMPHVLGKSLTGLPIKDIDISPLLKGMM